MNTTLTGDVVVGTGDSVTITLGDSAGGSNTLTVNTASAQNNTIAASINAAAAGDTISLSLTNTTGGSETLTFSNAIGGSAAATTIDTLTLGASTTATFNGTVRAGTITNSSANTTTFNQNVNATTLNFTTTGTVSLADTRNLTAAVTTGTTNQGTLTFLGTSTMTGDIGAVNFLLNAVNINGSGNTVTLTGDLNATTTTIANLATLSFTKAATTVRGGLTASGTTGTINLGTATVTMSTGAVTLDANSTLAVTIGTTNGQLISTASTGLTLASGTTITPTVSGTLAAGDITIVQNVDNDLGLGNGVTTGITITDNSSQFNFTLALTGNNLVLTVIDTGSSAGLSTNSAAINNVTTTAFASDTTLSNALNALSGSPRNAALETLAPVVSGGAVVGAISASGATASTISARVASLRTGISAGQGLSAGDGVGNEKHFWFQGFGTYADQGTRQGVTGFTSVTGGAALGADKQISNKLVLGIAGSFAYTDVNTSLSQNRTIVNSYQGTMYGSYEFGKYYIDAQLGAAYNDYNGDRFINVGAVERTANGDYDGYQVMGEVEIGRAMTFQNGITFTPSIGASMIHVGIPEYTETGAGVSNLNVKGQDYDILNATVRGELRRTYDLNNGSLTPEVHAGYNYEALDNPIQNISSFTGGGNTFQTTGFDPENHSVLGGLGVTYESAGNFDLVATYDLVTKTDYKSHSFLLKGRWDF